MAPSRAGKWELQVRCGGGDAGRAGEWHRAAGPPPPRYKGLGRAASLPAQAAVPSRATERDAPPAAASRVPRDTAAAGRPGPSSLHPPQDIRRRLTQKHLGREGTRSRSLGKAAHPCSGLGLEAARRQARETHKPRKFGAAPGERRAHPAPAASRPPGRGAGLFPRLHRAAQKEQRGRSATRGGSCNSRGPRSRLPQRRPRRSPHTAPGPCPQQAQGWAGDRFSGCRGGRRAPGPARVNTLVRALPAPGSREGPAGHPLRPAPRGLGREGVPRSTSAGHQQRRSLSAPRRRRPRRRRESAAPGRGGRIGCPSTLDPGPLRPGPRARSPSPAGLARQLRRLAARGRWRARRLRQRGSGQRPRTRGG